VRFPPPWYVHAEVAHLAAVVRPPLRDGVDGDSAKVTFAGPEEGAPWAVREVATSDLDSVDTSL
jgi:hypothetical protein